MERKTFETQIDQKTVDRTAITLAAREINCEEIIKKYRLMIRRILHKINEETDIERAPSDRIN